MAKHFAKLTRSAMRKLAKSQRIMEHGISFERLASGDGLFTVNVMVDGRRIHRTIGRESDGTTRTTCEDFIAKVRIEAREGRLNLPKRRKIAMTLESAGPAYIDRLRQEGGRDIGRKQQRLEEYLLPFLGSLPLSQITGFDVERYKKHRLSQPAFTRKKFPAHVSAPTNKPATVNRELATLSHLINKAVEWNWIERPPARIRKFKEDNGRIVFLTVQQADDLIEASKQDQNRQTYPFILIGLRTGMRKSEILSIRREHVDLPADRIFVPHAKAGGRSQPITPDLADFLRDYMATLPEGTDWLFPSESARSGHTQDIRKAFIRSVTRAGLDPKMVVRHTLRHTAITHLVQSGIDLPTVKRISGHKTMIMVERYAHQSGTHIAEAMGKLEERYKRTG